MDSSGRASSPAALLRADRADLCLEFANTLFWRGKTPATETLNKPADLLDWCAAAGGWDAAALGGLRARWQRHPAEAQAGFAQAVDLRETLYRVFGAVAAGGDPGAGDLDALNGALAHAPARRSLRRAAAGYAWQVAPAPRVAPALLAAVLWSAGDLLAGARRDRVRLCANPACRWLFLDDSKGGTRRWCAMSACGNRAKAHRHYRRRKEG